VEHAEPDLKNRIVSTAGTIMGCYYTKEKEKVGTSRGDEVRVALSAMNGRVPGRLPRCIHEKRRSKKHERTVKTDRKRHGHEKVIAWVRTKIA